MTGDKDIARVKTYVKGLDESLNGGVPENSIILIAGSPGTMKSSLAFHILYHNALNEGRKGVYITLEERRDSLISNMKGLGMDWGKVSKEMSILDLGLIRAMMDEMEKIARTEVFKMYIKNLRKNLDNDFLVIDSMAVLSTMADFKDPRKELFMLFEWLRDLDVTVFLVHEMPMEGLHFSDAGESFLSDGIFHMELRRENNAVNLFFGVLKLRKTDHSRDYYPLIYDGTFEIVKS